eukprot:TRINITY_DN5678_c0_g1_i1.p1 TRINITY_DN5678_c0_g1~~TRINITY_DN5678_c0_g1_i1.p1  ORF type:complete len:470 (+),score=70.18 TRINITY_DN5678_c0_g1_i1:48-1457(+)
MSLAELSDRIQTLNETIKVDIYNLDVTWELVTATFVFFMQCGFTMLEAGSVSRKVNVASILLKNLIDTIVGAAGFWLIGYAFAFGKGNAFIGYEHFALSGELPSDCCSYSHWLFQYVFCSTAITIPAGGLAERTRLRAYIIWSLAASMWIYPVIAHWAWSTTGWMSPFNGEDTFVGNNYVDFAGCGVVHMVGGIAGVVGAIIVGPRAGRWDAKFKNQWKPNDDTSVTIGALFLWFGWYGFNPGSIKMSGTDGKGSLVAALTAANTTISAAFGGITSLFIARILEGQWSIRFTSNGIVAGLVSITASASIVQSWAAMIAGIGGGLAYYGTSKLMVKLKIDDPLDVGGVHVSCGIWGLLVVGLLSEPEYLRRAYNANVRAGGLFTSGNAGQLAAQLTGIVVIFLWVTLWSVVVFGLLRVTKLLRVSEEVERKGFDEETVGEQLNELRNTLKDGTPSARASVVVINDDSESH